MSHYPSELCVLLVNDAYGELTSRIFEALLRHGRATILALQHFTRLSLRHIKHGLSVLVQQHLVFWYQGPEDKQAIFEANASSAYNLIRTGKYVKIAESRVGEYASTIVSHLLLLGHARVDDFIQSYEISHVEDMNGHAAASSEFSGRALPEEKHVNGKTNGDSSTTREKVNTTLSKLLRCGLIILAHEPTFRSDADNRMEAERNVKLPDYKAKSKREKDALQEAHIRKLLHQWNFGTKEEQSEIETLKTGKKRPLEDPENSSVGKRQRIDLDASKYAASSAGEGLSQLTFTNLLKNELVVRVNHHKFMVMMRNDHLVQLAEKAIGTVTSRVFEAALRQMEVNILACKEDAETLPSVTTKDLAALFNEDPDLADALGRVDPQVAEDLSHHPMDRRRKPNGDQEKVKTNGEASSEDDDGSISSGQESNDISNPDIDSGLDMANDDYDPNDAHHVMIRKHLLLLAQHPDRFLYQTEPDKWAIDFGVLRRNAILKMVFHTIDRRLDTRSTRLARICQQNGRMDDKSLQSKSLLTQKEMRTRLLKMVESGLLDLQEVPRDNSRLASRTTFLYYMDEGKSAAKIRDECYKTMVRCLQRLGFEREKVAGVLEKAERSDVKGKEEEFLGPKEKEALGRWKAQEEMIWGEVGRVDDVVAVLRDF